MADVSLGKQELKSNESLSCLPFIDTGNQSKSIDRLLRKISDNFQQQFNHIYPERVRPFLVCKNEENDYKFLCTSIAKSYVPQRDCYDWYTITRKLRDSIALEEHQNPCKIPDTLRSPKYLITQHTINILEFVTLLQSLLLGVGYDAFICSGYASKRICFDERHDIDLDEEGHILEEIPELELLETCKDENASDFFQQYRNLENKYKLNQSEVFFDNLLSSFDQEIGVQIIDHENNYNGNIKEAINYMQKNVVDSLEGLRIHFWILIRRGKRDISESFFLDPISGKSFDLKCSEFLGIEQVWNDRNIWMNIQSCQKGLANVKYDFDDNECWEPILPLGKLQEKQLNCNIHRYL
ncbi:MAG: hypothetical protein MHMPM18_002901 [Marteilia pararefringens]